MGIEPFTTFSSNRLSAVGLSSLEDVRVWRARVEAADVKRVGGLKLLNEVDDVLGCNPPPHPSGRIVAAAVVAGGKVWTLPPPNRHANILWWIEAMGLKPNHPADQGFIDDLGGFVAREVAGHRALACGQVEKLSAPPNLFSEDLW